jgi:hypothetical protein
MLITSHVGNVLDDEGARHAALEGSILDRPLFSSDFQSLAGPENPFFSASTVVQLFINGTAFDLNTFELYSMEIFYSLLVLVGPQLMLTGLHLV